MQKTTLTDSVLARMGSRPAFSKVRLVGLLVMAGAILAAASFLGKTALDLVVRGHSASTEPHQISIGGQALLVPENLIRRRQDRQSGVRSQLELYLRWPELQGYTHATSASFNGTSQKKDVVFISVSSSDSKTDRLQGAYLAVTDRGETGASGLELRQFQQDIGFADEVLAVGERAPSEPFLARCLTKGMAANSLAPCERRLPFINGLTIVYRFSEDLLPDWRLLDDMLLKRLTALRQADD